MRRSFNIWLFVAAVVLIPSAVFAVVKWYEHRFTELPVLGANEHRVGSFTLQDQHGRTTTINDWNDHIIVANLFFTHCPVVCPKMIRSLKNVQQLYARDQELAIYSFSVDPERDSVERLREFAQRMDITADNWHLLTGSKQEIYRYARKSLQVVATDGDGGPGDFIHSELLVLIDKEKRIRGYYNGTEPKEVEALLRDIGRLKRSYR